MRRSIMFLGVLLTILLTVSTESFAKITVNTTSSKDGYITVSTDKELTKRIKVRIQKGNEQVTHDLVEIKENVPYALTFGNGEYEIKIFENQSDDLYSVIQKKKINVNIEDENKVYLNSTNEIKWNENQKVIQIAKEITKDLQTDEEKIKAVYQFVVDTYDYDFEKLAKLPTTYKPDLDEFYNDKKGICYDYSATFAGMLRSLGIPTRLVKGYSLSDIKTFHAWNEVLVNGEWKSIDTTNDSYAIKKGRSVEMYRNPNSFIVTNRY